MAVITITRLIAVDDRIWNIAGYEPPPISSELIEQWKYSGIVWDHLFRLDRPWRPDIEDGSFLYIRATTLR
jgi:hypothetical protein